MEHILQLTIRKMRVTMLVLCALACFVQSVFGQCLGCGGIAGPFIGATGLNLAGGIAYDGLNAGCGVASTGGSFTVSSASPLPPVGLNVVSENIYEGSLRVEGNLPLLGSVGLEGALGTAGAGAVSYGCGDGAIGITVEEGPIVTGILAPGAFGPGVSGNILGAGLIGSPLAFGAIGAGGLAPGLAYGAGFGYGNGLIGAGIGPGCGCGYGAVY